MVDLEKKKKHRSKELASVDKISERMGHTGEFFRRRDGWRKHPLLTSNLRQATPGLGIALVAFGIYLVGEQVYNRVIAPSPSHSHHTHHQHSAASSSH
ncbi:NADH dehydrogenase [ubiquinone] 1 beta subcomplex subunit 3-B [Citrus clementina]|uniref:NADH dehydrogenase [ubiquinone] 1 beta subcomplex subunit 3-B n=1 Tax=Citrus clementina TaxID=85681 RepID=UPI000CED1A81|nr:NADH dehydrogenase [ubiquinone] 1 beta subcomplex subunit 3-B [Citrus x clementina]